MADVHPFYYEGIAPGALDPKWALEYARYAASKIGLTIPEDAESTIRYAPDGSGRYRVETPANYPPS
ncbi:hypothetical protein [Streptomyces gardneri]|uniref:hypothetical protein n=1 Tax=Streptomyces gardneri TaxID=66892 RepID=UPI0035E27D3E